MAKMKSIGNKRGKVIAEFFFHPLTMICSDIGKVCEQKKQIITVNILLQSLTGYVTKTVI